MKGKENKEEQEFLQIARRSFCADLLVVPRCGWWNMALSKNFAVGEKCRL
jgi:hypothetical protein